MKAWRVGIVVAALLLSAGAVGAEVIPIPANGYGWQTFLAADVNQNNTPYWDGRSADGSGCGIGYWITGSNLSGCGNRGGAYVPGPGAALPEFAYWGNSLGQADPNISFANVGQEVATLELEIAGNRGSNIFGWYSVADPANRHVLFNGAASPVTTVAFTPNGTFGFYLQTTTAVYYSESFRNLTDTNFQHFAIFKGMGPNQYFIGAEDQPVGTGSIGDRDYNDLVAATVPEPASMLLLGTGLIGLAGAGRRRFRK